MEEPPVKVKCGKCGGLCSAQIVKMKMFGKEFKKWEFVCSNWKCELAFETVQHTLKVK